MGLGRRDQSATSLTGRFQSGVVGAFLELTGTRESIFTGKLNVCWLFLMGSAAVLAQIKIGFLAIEGKALGRYVSTSSFFCLCISG